MKRLDHITPAAAPPLFFKAASQRLGVSTDLCVLGVPYDHAVNAQRPVSLAPLAIRRQSRLVESGPGGVYPWGEKLDPERITDSGDFSFNSEAPVIEILDLLSRRVGQILDHGASPLLLGGVHTVSLGALGPCARRFGKLALLQFDAHEDISGGESDPPHNGNWVRKAVQNHWIDPSRSAQVFLRTSSSADKSSPLGLNRIWAADCREGEESSLAQKLRELTGPLPVYLSFDIDAVDPAFAPGTGNPAFGGPSARQVLALLHALRGIPVVAADVVEVSPDLDVRGLTALLGAHIGINLLYLLATARKKPASSVDGQ